MAYVRSKVGAQFGGLGGTVAEEVKKAMCELFPDQCGQAVSAGLDTIRKQSTAAVESLSKQSWYGPVLAESLMGASNPMDLAKEAQAIAQGFSSNLNDQAIYKFFYGQARSALELGDKMLSKYPEMAALHTFVQQQEKLYIEGASIFKKYEKVGIDAAGVGDTMNLLKRSVASARGIARAFGVDEGSTADEVMDWTGTVLGCGASIATGAAAGGVGAVGGALACGVMVLSKIFTKLTAKPLPGPNLGSTFWAVFRPLNKEQQGVIAADAARLAALLKYRYGVLSWNAFISGLTMWADLPYVDGDINNTNHPQEFSAATAKMLLIHYPPSGENKATGFTTRNVLDLLDAFFGTRGQWSYTAYGVATKMNLPEAGLFHESNKGLVYGDVPVVPLMRMAPLAAKNFPGVMFPYTCTSGCRSLTEKESAPIRVYGELINFFAAVTKRELELDAGQYLMPWSAGLPVTFQFADMSLAQWTKHSSRGTINNLMNGVSYGSDEALWEFANLRLLAAMSYLQMSYRWGIPNVTGPEMLRSKKDMIAELPNLDPADRASLLRIPIDPKSQNGVLPSLHQIHSKIRSTSQYMANIAEKAQQAAWKNGMQVAQLAGEAKRQMLMLQKGAPTAAAAAGMTAAAFKAMIAARGGLELVSEAGKKCIDAGGAYFPGGAWCDVNPTTKKLENCRAPSGHKGPNTVERTCVPRGTPGSTTTPGAIIPAGTIGEVKKVGAGTILAVAGAGLLLMRLLRS